MSATDGKLAGAGSVSGTSGTASADFYADFGKLTELRKGARAQDPAALREAARQFESIFARMMLSSMREASFGDSLTGSDQQEFYKGMFDDQMSVELTKGKGLGLADMLIKQLTQAGLVAAPQAAAPKGATAAAGTSEVPGLKTLPSIAPTSAASTRSPTGVWTPAPWEPGGSQWNKPAAENPSSFAPNRASGRTDSSGTAQYELTRTTSGSAMPEGVPTPFSADLAGRGADIYMPDETFNPLEQVGSALPEPSVKKAWRPASRNEFVRDLWPAAEAAGRELGVDPKTLIAHAALETGWGKSMPRDASGNSSHNLFGVKATSKWDGSAVNTRTIEVEGGVAVTRKAKFRAYDSPSHSFNDYVALLRDNPRYAKARGTGSNAAAFATALQKAGYATDPAYASKLTAVARSVSNVHAAVMTASNEAPQDAAHSALKLAEHQPITAGSRTI